NDVRQNARWRLRGVAASEGHAEFTRKFQQTLRKSIYPCLTQFRRQSQGQKSGDWFPAHGRNVAQTSRQTAMANHFRRVPCSPEVHVFQAEIGGGDQIAVRGNAQHGAVVANSGHYSAIFWRWCAAVTVTLADRRCGETFDLRNQRFF